MAKILTFCDYFTPGFKGGGPIKTLRTLADHIRQSHRLVVVTRDRDLGDKVPYDGKVSGQRVRLGELEVVYLRSTYWSLLRACIRLIRSENADLIYLNSFHSRRFTLAPLFVAGLIAPATPVLIAPRGEFATAALARGKVRKQAYHWFLRATGLLDGVTFQASTEQEADDIRAVLGRETGIVIAPDLPELRIMEVVDRPTKLVGRAKIVFLGRLSPMKNIDWLIDLLGDFDGRIELDVVGPIEDKPYYRRCQNAVARLPSNVNVRFVGPVAPAAVYAHLSDSDALVLPSLGENYGHVVPEALSVGCPVIVSDRTPWARVADRGCGWWLPLELPDRWLNAFRELVTMNEREHAVLRRAAVEMGQSLAHDTRAVSANLRAFEIALGGRPNPPAN